MTIAGLSAYGGSHGLHRSSYG